MKLVIVSGLSGSGKSTQLPKICLSLGRGVCGRIGHTQPRRIAARSLATRVAAELGEQVGASVGYKVRFRDRVEAVTQGKLLTDGMLLAEIQQDRWLNEYDTLIIDEAHERSLNIDFLLGYLKMLLPQRSDLKLIVTSATIDTERFSRHFDDAPVIEVSGRTYPVDASFVVYNEVNYPLFVRLLDRLGVATRESDMSFSFRNEATGLEYAVPELRRLLAVPANLLRPRFWRMLRQILRFYREAESAGRLAHPNIITVVDAGEDK